MRTQNKALVPVFVTLLATALLAPRVSSAEASKVEGEFYIVTVTTTTADGKHKAKISAKGKGGYKCNEKYPWKLTVQPSTDGAKKLVLKKKDTKKLSKEEVVFEVSTVPSAGKKTVAKLKLSTCDDKQCKMATVDLAW